MRPNILLGGFVFLFALLIYRLSYWQIVKGADLSKSAQSQYKSSSEVRGERGNILASDGSYLAIRTDSWNIFLETAKVNLSPSDIARKLSPILYPDDTEDEKEENLEKLISQKRNWILIEKKIDTQTKKNIEALKIDGIGFQMGEARFYPEASSSAQILGFLGKDEAGEDIGYFGLEGYYNLPLSGKIGYKGAKKDAKGSQILTESSIEISAQNGVDLVTSIDKRVQLLIEDKLKEGIEKYGAIGGSISIMNPNNGEVLGMASLPSFDPANYEKYNDALFKNPIISDTFEPGSIFKVLVMAAGLDSGEIQPDTQCDNCGSALKVDKYLIKTWNNKYTENISMTDVIVHSDNVGMVYIGRKLGEDKLYDYLDSFGIGQKTGIDLQGEVQPRMREKGTWSEVDLATTTFGQGIAVSGIQMLRAVSVIANGGYLITPHVVKRLAGPSWEEDVDVARPQRVLSEKSARETALMMVEAVNKGESQWAKPKGFNNIAGKTGTAQIAVSGQYDEKNTNHSFIGFAPFDKPKMIMLVTLKSPQSSPWAAETAAPLWFNIANELFPYLGVAPGS